MCSSKKTKATIKNKFALELYRKQKMNLKRLLKSKRKRSTSML